jgi:hypothetical protein
MTPDAALDNLAYLVGLRLMGPDARRRLRLALGRDPGLTHPPGFDMARVGHVDALAEGRWRPETLQDHLDLKRVHAERLLPPFDAAFWATRSAELVRAGFEAGQAARLIEAVRRGVEPVTITPAAEICHA